VIHYIMKESDSLHVCMHVCIHACMCVMYYVMRDMHACMYADA
jgi:hypothetical protein